MRETCIGARVQVHSEWSRQRGAPSPSVLVHSSSSDSHSTGRNGVPQLPVSLLGIWLAEHSFPREHLRDLPNSILGPLPCLGAPELRTPCTSRHRERALATSTNSESESRLRTWLV